MPDDIRYSPMITALLDSTADNHADAALVRTAAKNMATRLAQKRGSGRSGWHTAACDTAELRRLLNSNLADDDMLDVAILASMIDARRGLYPDPGPDRPATNATTGLSRATFDPLAPPRMIKLHASGAPLYDDMGTQRDHAMVLLPDYGLIFDARPPRHANNWAEAERFASETDLPGDGWRLPSVKEMSLLIERSRHSPAINTNYFPNTPTNDWYWTGTAYASSPAGYAWVVAFHDGYVASYDRGSSGFVRACRRVPPGQ